MRWNLPFQKIEQLKVALSTIEKFQRIILHHLRSTYASHGFTNNSFGKILMDFAMENDLTNEEIMSEIFLFMIAGE